MVEVDIKIKKGKTGYLDGPFFVKELDFEDCMSLQSNESGDEHSRLIQMCLVDADGNNVFKPQQIKLIKERISGVDMGVLLVHATGLNDFEKIAGAAELYKKN